MSSDIFIHEGIAENWNKTCSCKNWINCRTRKNESLLRLDVNNFDFSSADIDNDSWSTNSDESDQPERVNKARQSEDYATSDSQSVSDFPKKNIYQSDDSFTVERRSEDEDDQSDDEESTESDNWGIELYSLEPADSDINNRSYLFLLM